MGVGGVVEKALQNERGGDGVDVALAQRALDHLAQLALGFDRGERLVDQHHRQAVAGRQPPREARRAPRERVLGAVGMPRLPDDERGRAPFGLEPVDRGEPCRVARFLDHAHGARDADGDLER